MQCRQTDAKLGQNHLAGPNSVLDDASQSAVLLILCLVSVQLISELFGAFFKVVWHFSFYSYWN